MAKIHLVDNLYFKSDSMNYILLECDNREKIDLRTKQGTGEFGDYETVLGYYGSFEALVKGAMRVALKRDIAEDRLTTLDEVLQRIQELNKCCNEILNEHK